MENQDVEQAWQAMTVIEAQECLIGIDVSTFPHMSEDGQSKTHRRLFKLAYPKDFEAPKQISVQDLARVLNG